MDREEMQKEVDRMVTESGQRFIERILAIERYANFGFSGLKIDIASRDGRKFTVLVHVEGVNDASKKS